MLVITPKNELKRLYCPFLVSDGNNKLHNVTAIAAGNNFKIYYMINGQYYEYDAYRIMN